MDDADVAAGVADVHLNATCQADGVDDAQPGADDAANAR